MKAIVNFSNGTSLLVKVDSSWSQGGTHYYRLILNKLNTFLDFEAGEMKLFTGNDITSLRYVMG